jgi:hypothetical protein
LARNSAAIGHAISVPLQEGAVQRDSDWAVQKPADQGGEKGQAGADTLANLNLQNDLQSQSKIQQELSNTAKGQSDSADAIVRNEK